MKVLVTGGCGYIGSHTCVELLNEGYEVIIIDNLVNSKKEVVSKIEEITGKKVKFYENDCCDKDALRKIFKENNHIDSVIHFAGLKAVGESVKLPVRYYENNLGSTLSIVTVMKEYKCNKIVFSSSATVYGTPEELPVPETAVVGGTNSPYGTTKYFIERILKDVSVAEEDFSVVLLRYFNPIGAHESGLIGEDPNGIPNNLMPYIIKVATGELPILNVFGDDYDTPDGTGVRDYIHVVDLAKGHIKALEKADEGPGVKIYNLGTGRGYSVLEIINTFERVNNVKVKYQITERRAGDIDIYYADPSKAEKELNWKAEKDIDDMCKDAYNFIIKNK
ncbi:MAG: UDP-glucose 4-epimerase GalE [Bacilli bacterium]|nr:UDP-glucose 4-epimerase GalE [Bacilli bacterium]